MLRRHFDQRWRGILAGIDTRRTTRRKTAACGRIEQARRHAVDGLKTTTARPVEARHRTQQARRIGMQGFVENARGRALLGDTRRIHDIDSIGIAGNHAEVMRDDDQRDAELARKIFHQLQNLRLDRHIERGGRLVGDQ